MSYIKKWTICRPSGSHLPFALSLPCPYFCLPLPTSLLLLTIFLLQSNTYLLPNGMACYFSVARITWAGRCRGGLLPSASSSLPLFSSFQRTHQHAGHRLRLPLNLRYKSTNNVDSTIKSKGYKFMTKSRTGIGSFASLCSHAASICTVFAYCNTDMFELRCLAMSSGVLAMSFQYFRPQPLWIPIRWGCLILCINGCMITQLLFERHRANHMPPELKKIYDEGSFDERGFSKVQFMKFFKHARRTVFVGKEIISQEGREMNKL